MDYFGQDRRRAVPGRRGGRSTARARFGPADPGLRGAADRGRAPATNERWRSTSPTTIRAISAASTRHSTCGSPRSRPSACPSSPMSSRRSRPGFDTLAELREDIANRLREGDEQAIEREFEDAVLGRGCGRGRDRRPREAGSRARTRDARPDALGRWVGRASRRRPICGSRARTRRRWRTRPSRRPPPTLPAAKRSWPQSSRPSSSSPPRSGLLPGLEPAAERAGEDNDGSARAVAARAVAWTETAR